MKVRRCDVVRSLLVMAATSLCTLQPAQAISHAVRVFINRGVDLVPSNGRYYIPVGSPLTIQCICFNDPVKEVQTRDLIINGVHRNNSISECNLPIQEIFLSVSGDDTGSYLCDIHFNNGSSVQKEANIYVYNNNDYSLHAPAVQYGLLTRSTSLLCDVTSNISDIYNIMWTNPSGNEISGTIGPLTLAHEGLYKCEVFFADISVLTNTFVQLVVLVPPTILPSGTSPLHSAYIYNSNVILAVHFMSKNQSDTSIYWYKDEKEIQQSRPRYNTTDSMNSWTDINFHPIRRSDAGRYHVVIENAHNFIHPNLRITDISLVVEVTILPARPTEVNFHHFSGKLTWTYHNVTTDDTAQEQTVMVNYSNTTLALQRQLAGDDRQIDLSSLIPGENYIAHVIARNIDGTNASLQKSFLTLPGAPLATTVIVTRRPNNTVHLQAVLHYTGGGTITHFVISFRYIGNTEWISLPYITATRAGTSKLLWTGEVMDARFADLESKLEFEVQLINSNKKISSASVHKEQIDLPGAPREVSVVTSDHTSITLRFMLSKEGSTPFTYVEAELFYNTNKHHKTNITAVTSLSPGSDVDVTIADLQKGTEYIITIAVYNRGGRGIPSNKTQVATLVSALVPEYGIALLVTGGGIILLAVAVLVIIRCKKGSSKRRKKREYPIGEVEARKHLPAEHSGLKCGNKVPHSPISPTPPTPSTATSIVSPRISPMTFCSTPQYLSSSTCISGIPNISALHQHGQATDDHTAPLSSFKFCTGSSRSNSVNQDSDLSESNSPRCTYSFSRSEEVPPQIGRSHDHVDLLRDHIPFLPISEDGSLHCSTMSHDLLRFTGKSRLNSDASHNQLICGQTSVPGFASQHRAQSAHSVTSPFIRHTGSDSNSTRDCLIFPRIESNITEV